MLIEVESMSINFPYSSDDEDVPRVAFNIIKVKP